MYDDERKILTDRLDKPVIHNRKKIRDKYRQDIQTMGQTAYQYCGRHETSRDVTQSAE